MSSDATMLSPGGDAARRESQAPASKHRAKPGKGQSTASKAKGELKQAKIDFSKAKPFKPEGLESKKRKRNEDQVVDLELELPTDRVDDSLSPELPGDVERGDGSNDRKLVDGNEGKIDLVPKVTPRSSLLDTMSEQEVEKRLRAFDLHPDFGPCVGLTRLERWERAHSLGLEPPALIKELVECDVAALNKPLWDGLPF